MHLYIIEGLDKTGKTTYTKNKFAGYSKIRMPGGFEYSQEMRTFFLEGKIPHAEMIHIIFGEHMAALQHLYLNTTESYVLDRSFISYLVYQKEFLMKYGYYDTYKQILEEMFKKLSKKYDIKILYFSKQLVQRKDDWLEHMDPDELKKNFNELLEQEPYSSYVDHIDIECKKEKQIP
jgi:thymidylate kinase